jgi:hypothetical protein
VAAHSEACSIRSLERRNVGLTSPGDMVVFPLFMLVMSCVCRGLAIAQLAVVVSEVDSEW